MSRSQLIDDVNALAATAPPTIDRLLDRRPDASPRAAMRALSTWRIRRWLAAEPGREKAAFEDLIAGVVDDAEIMALRGEMAAGADVDRRIEEMHQAMDERLAYWIRRALAADGASGRFDAAAAAAPDHGALPMDTPAMDAPAIAPPPVEDDGGFEDVPAFIDDPAPGAEIIPLHAAPATEDAPPTADAAANDALAARAERAEAEMADMRAGLASLLGQPARGGVAARRGLAGGRLNSRFSR